MKTQNTKRKTTKTELLNALDSFRYTMDWVTGGTAEETRRQAPHAIIELQAKADAITAMLGNLNKVAANSGFWVERAKTIPARLEKYRAMYLQNA
jgi:hypothetical protein